ncbi:MAG: glutathione peroxidase [Flavobacteriaceae bacterium]|nr:glutathione peroxidase [Flavobacteriaceae bacterium]
MKNLILFFVITFCLTQYNTHAQAMKNLHDYTAERITGETFDFSSLKGKKVIIVNTASECGLTPQYAEIQELYETLKGGEQFEIIGFPANNFGAQEPGTNQEIAYFCSANYGVSFPMMEKISVKGDDQHPIYQFLTQKALNGKEDVEMQWNFQKFLIDEAGNYVGYLSPKTSVLNEETVAWLKS